MSFQVDDGSGLTDANSYVDVDYADSYFLDRNNIIWSALTKAQKEALLILGTDYIETTYYDSFKGVMLNNLQALQFPRVDVYGLEINYDRVKKAVCELALRANDGDLNKDIDRQAVEETVDVITIKYSASSDPKTRYPLIATLLTPLLSNGKSGVNVSSYR